MVAAVRLEGRALFAHPLSPAVMRVLRRGGYDAASMEAFAEEAAISQSELEDHFEGKEDLVLRVFEAHVEDFLIRVGDAYSAVPTWPENLRAAAYEFARWVRRHPDATWFGMVGVLNGPELGRVQRERAFRFGADLIDAGREVAPEPGAVPASAPLLAVGAIAEVLRREQEAEGSVDLVGLVPELMYGAVRPYLGADVAARELSISPPSDLAKPDDDGSRSCR